LGQAVSISESAAKRIAFLTTQETGDVKLRVTVQGGGCSGFQYGFDFDSEVKEDDLVLERDGAIVLIDEMSLEFMQGAEIDFVDDLMAAAFKINNPNASASCGCGTSFSI
jgi:iron-sulfur cluster insertion protein